MKFQKLNRSIFNFEDTNIGRLDLCYDLKLKASEKDLNLFFENSSRRIGKKKSYNQSAKFNNNILRVEKRSSSNFFQVYLKHNEKELRFKIELKKM